MLKFSIYTILLFLAVIDNCQSSNHVEDAVTILMRDKIENLRKDLQNFQNHLHWKDEYFGTVNEILDANLNETDLHYLIINYSFLMNKINEIKYENNSQDESLIKGNYKDFVRSFIYANGPESISYDSKRLLTLTHTLRSIENTQKVLTELWNELKDKSLPMVDELLVSTVKKEIIEQKRATKEQKQNAYQIIYSICAKYLRESIDDDRNSIRLNECRRENSTGITHEMINDLFSEMSTSHLLQFIRPVGLRFGNEPDILVYIYNKLKEEDNKSGLIELAKSIWGLPDEKKKLIYKELFDISKSLKTLYFASKMICIKNAQYSEHMSVEGEKDDVMTWTPEDKYRISIWSVREPFRTALHDPNSSDIFEFRNLKPTLGHLYVSNRNFRSKNRNVTVGSTYDDGKEQFKLELHGDAVAIKNVYYNHYICAMENLFQTSKRDVLAVVRGIPTSPSCQWLLEDCSQLKYTL